MDNNHTDYLEQLFQGVDILIDRKLKDISFDTTIICTIVDASDSKNGRYQVTDGTVRFEAYSDNDKYKVNDQVRVSIIKGDLIKKKFIVGKYVTDNYTQPITYVSPLNTVVNITGNLIPNDKQGMSIIANGKITEDDPDPKHHLICCIPLADGAFADLQTNGIYNTITLKADFKTFLHNYNVKSGTYGLQLDLVVKPNRNSTRKLLKTAYLESSEMFGNPYAFSIATQQTKIFDIGTVGIITDILLTLYQDGNFFDINGNKIEPALIGNITVENIELGFGSDLIAIGDNTLKIYTESDPQYKYYGHNPYPYDKKLGYPNEINKVTNEKRLGLLWYNKNDLNEYLGFSDGLYDPDYDEIEYLDLAKEDTRLTAQMGREGIPTDQDSLNLAANLEEAIPLIIKAMKVVTQDLTTTLRALRSQVEGVTTFTNEIDKLIALAAAGGSDSLAALAADIDNNLELLEAQYKGVLAHGVKTQNLEWASDSEKVNNWNSKWDIHYGNNIKIAFKTVRQKIEALLNNVIKPGVYGDAAAYSGYAGVYDTYKIRLERVLNTLEEYLDPESKYDFPIDVFNGVDYNTLQSYKNTKTQWKSYIKKDLSAYDNKYCIYWFRYDKDYVNNEVHQFLSNGWRRLTELPRNIGVPGKGEKIDGKTYNAIKLAPGEGLIDVIMRFNESEEKYKAVLFYNHAMYESDELIFTNEDRIPETANIETGDLLIFEHIDKSRNDYQCYNLTNYLMDSADASHLRQIRIKYDGLLHGDEILAGGGIYWYVPNTSTMLTVDIDELITHGFVTDYEMNPKPPYSKTGYICFYKQVQGEKDESGKWTFLDGNGFDTRDFWYKIKPYYDASASINSIKCEFRAAADNDIVSGEEFFNFGVIGSNGTKYTLSINPATNQVATLPTKNLILDVSLRDFNNEEIDLSIGANGVGQISEFTSSWLFKLSGNAPTKIEDGNKVIGLTAFGGSCGIVKASTKFQLSAAGAAEETAGTVKYRTVTLETVRAIPAAAGDYYISGPTSIIYNSFGTIDNRSMFDNPYKLFAMKKITLGFKTYNPNDQIDVNWDIEYYNANGVQFTDENNKEYQFYRNYMPIINDAGGLTPASLYLDNIDCYAVVKAYSAITNDLLWSQPIVITQNRFASSVLNDWDGSLIIDKKNGTILSSMVGAGRKTENNTFQGVLMGDIGGNAGIDLDAKTGYGVYGFNDGAQSFGFNIDGTAFIGKAGRGRIKFDGNKGAITSASYEQTRLDRSEQDGAIIYDIPAGMKIDLDDGYIDIRGASLGSDGNRYKYYETVYKEDGTTATINNTIASRYANHILLSATGTNGSTNTNQYFLIEVPWNKNSSGIEGAWQLKPLISIGLNNYFLQSRNYRSGTYWITDGIANDRGEGTYFDLVKGYIDAFNFKLTSKNVMIDSSDEATAFLVVKNNISGNNLIYIGSDGYYLKSDDFDPIGANGVPGAGMKIDLSTGHIHAFDFELRSSNIIIDAYDNDGAGLITFTGDSGTNTLSITNNPNGIPIEIGNAFKIKWDGSIQGGSTSPWSIDAAGNAKFTNADLSGNINISGNLNVSGTGSIGNWKVTSDGNLQSANNSVILNGSTGAISGSAISGGTISGTNISGSSIKAGETFNVTSGGKLTATNAELTSLTVHGTLAVKTTGKFELSGEGWISGHLKIGQSSYNNDYHLYVNGKSYLTGHVGIGIAPNDTWDLRVNGKTRIGGHTGIGTDPVDDYVLKVSGDTYITGHLGIGIEPDNNYDLRVNGKSYFSGTLYFSDTDTYLQVNKDSGGGMWFYGSTITLATNKVQLGVGNTDCSTLIYHYLEIPEDTHIRVGNITYTLPNYIAEFGGGFTLIGDNKVAIANSALTLANGSGTKYSVGSTNWPVYFSDGTPVAISVGSAGQVLATNSNATGLEWKTTYHRHSITLYKSSTGLLYAAQNSSGTLTQITIYTSYSYV